MPPFRAERTPRAEPDLAASVSRLCSLAGAAPPPLHGNEREALLAALPALAVALNPLRAALGGGLLARLLWGPRFDGEPWKAPRRGEVFASAEADVWVLEPRADGTARVTHTHPESVSVLGETVALWLAREADAVEAARAPRKRVGKALAGKPAIDDALARLAGTASVSSVLAATAHAKQAYRWQYLLLAVKACGSVWPAPVLQALEGRLLGRVLAGRLNDNDDEACICEEGEPVLEGVNPVYLGRYPRAAREHLESGHIVASSGTEHWVIRREAKGAPMNWGIRLFHCDHDGFEELGSSVEAWLAFELDRLGL